MPISTNRLHRYHREFAFWAATMFAVSYSAVAAENPANPPQFERDVWPIISAHCIACHGAHEPKSGLDLRSVAAIERGGESGAAFDQANPQASLLLEKITQAEMPPPDERELSPDEIALLKSWILAGAPANSRTAIPPPISLVRDADREFWSFRPLKRPVVPTVRDEARVRTPIDAFLLQKLNAKGLSFSSDADPTILVRRAYFDLIGLPPGPDEVDEFLRDQQPGSFDRLVDRLMALPQFGERWGRHWLDVAGYVDTVGFDTDATNVILSEGKWRYRDYVIQAFNEDKPYDRFVTEQIAGDELYDWRRANRFSPDMRNALIATGYLRTARDLSHEQVGVIPQNFFGVMHDTLETFGTGILGLTLNCVRCHSHKFDPIPQEDYYRLMATLTPAYNPLAWRPVIAYESGVEDRSLPDVGPEERAEIERFNKEIERRADALRKALVDQRRPHEERLLAGNLAKLPEAIRSDTKTALETPADRRSEVQKYLVDKFAAEVSVTPEQLQASLSDDENSAAAALESQIVTVEQGRKKWGKIQALFDVAPPPPTHLLLRGSEQSPGPEVQPGYLRVLCKSEQDSIATLVPPFEGTSGHRLALAHWLTARGTPAEALVARVMVNRLWQHVFGRGIVATPENFGARGQPPSHPELLEWLSVEFVSNGWHIKPLLRQMLLSTAYRQSSRPDASHGESAAIDPDAIDPANDLLWRMRLRRLESEVVRDSMLSVSGTLNLKMGGPPVPTNSLPDGMVVVSKEKLSDAAEGLRRSIYLVSRRAYNLSLLTVFDQPLVATNCVERNASAVPLQSLFMMNDAFVAEQAEKLAKRVEESQPAVDDSRIAAVFRFALARLPTDNEFAACRELLRQHSAAYTSTGTAPEDAGHQALTQLSQVMLNTSEFLYVE